MKGRGNGGQTRMGKDVDGKVELGGFGAETLVNELGENGARFVIGLAVAKGDLEVLEIFEFRELRNARRDHHREEREEDARVLACDVEGCATNVDKPQEVRTVLASDHMCKVGRQHKLQIKTPKNKK